MEASELKVDGAPAQLGPYLRSRVEVFHPAYFALTMATGIVAIDCHLLGLKEAAAFLSTLNVPAYCVLWTLTILRAALYPKAFVRDWSSHQRGPGFFTAVAATCVLGVQVVVLQGSAPLGFALWCLGIVLWAVCTYAIFVLLSIREEKPSLAEGINGGWLVAVVATQSVCLLGCKVLPGRFANQDAVFFFLASLWLCGGMLYIWMISLIFYRYMFFKFAPSDLMPPYWINMGAVAVSTLAGATLVSAAGGSPLLAGILPFVKGLTLMFWATATWWIPMLLILGIWRHRVRGQRLSYDPLYWGLVFPLGMYSVCTYSLARVFEVRFLVWIAQGFAVVALSAWLLTFFGMATRLLFLFLLATRRERTPTPHPVPSQVVQEHATGGSP
jgi:tellurite resistance protein TehA-like permease